MRILAVRFTEMIQTKKRKEVSLDSQTLTILQIKAEKEGRNLKNYMEQILKERANTFEISDEYKKMMDNLIENHKNGTLKTIPEADIDKRRHRK